MIKNTEVERTILIKEGKRSPHLHDGCQQHGGAVLALVALHVLHYNEYIDHNLKQWKRCFTKCEEHVHY